MRGREGRTGSGEEGQEGGVPERGEQQDMDGECGAERCHDCVFCLPTMIFSIANSIHGGHAVGMFSVQPWWFAVRVVQAARTAGFLRVRRRNGRGRWRVW